MYTPLFNRSCFTLTKSLLTVEKIVELASFNKCEAVAIVDENLAYYKPFQKACEKANIKAIYGLSFKVKVETTFYQVFLLAKNDKGFKNLLLLASYLSLKENYLELEKLDKYQEGNFLFLCSDDMPLSVAIDNNLDLNEAYTKQKGLFKDHYIALVQQSSSYQAKRNDIIRELLAKNNEIGVAINRTYYEKKEDSDAHKVFRCIGEKKKFNEDLYLQEGNYFFNEDDYQRYYQEEEINLSNYIADQCNVEAKFVTSLPSYKLEQDVDSKTYLKALAYKGLEIRLNNEITDKYKSRLKKELDVICEMGFADYFLIVYDYVKYAKRNNILVGPGRGSAAGSLVSYCLGISDIDPVKYNLFFERFLNKERSKMPDIDIDFEDNKRYLLFNYVADKYGKSHVAHISTYSTLKARAVLRDVARVFEYDEKNLNNLMGKLPRDRDLDLKACYEKSSEFKKRIDSSETLKKIYEYSLKLENLPRNYGTHASGIVMSKDELSEVIALRESEDDDSLYAVDTTMKYLEEMGLIKMDFLGLSNLSVIAEILQEIEEKIDINKIPLADLKTYELLSNGDTLGVFQLESEGMNNLITKLKPKDFEDIPLTLALYRPGPMQNISTLLKNRENPNNISYLHPDLKPILEDTYGIIIYQEQILMIATKMAGFSLSKADILREAMSKKKIEILEGLRSDFIGSCLNNGYEKKLVEEVYQLISRFAEYGYNKSHAYAYGMIAYQMAYLKANYPLPFYKAVLNGQISNSSKTYLYLQEIRKRKIKVLPVNILNSKETYQNIDGCLLLPFTLIKDIGSSVASNIVKAVDKFKEDKVNLDYSLSEFYDLLSYLSEYKVDKQAINSLMKANAFYPYEKAYVNKNTILAKDFLDKTAFYTSQRIGLLDNKLQPKLEVKEESFIDSCKYEREVFGFNFFYDPLQKIKEERKIDCPSLMELEIGESKGFGFIGKIRVIRDKRGREMAFIEVFDAATTVSLTMFASLYEKHADKLKEAKYIYFVAKMESKNKGIINSYELMGEENENINR